MMDFEWNKGGDFAGKPWSTELPTDSALVLFLFAAFVEAPHWEWPQGHAGTKGARFASSTYTPFNFFIKCHS